jgi:uncharacterized membrane protein
MIISNKSLLKPALLVAGVSLFLVGCSKAEDDPANSAPSTTGATASNTPENQSKGTDETVTASFATVHDILKTRCLQCHNGPAGKEGVDMTSYESIMKGGKDGPIVVAKDADNSLLVKVIRGAQGVPHMPPQGDPLSEDQIKSIEDWIKAGAPNS